MTDTNRNQGQEGLIMEKTMAMNERTVGIENTKEVVKEMARDMKRGHVAIWLEILRDVRGQWEEAEHGRFHRTAR